MPPKKSSKKPPIDPSRQWSLDELTPHLPDVKPAELAALRDGIVAAQTDDEIVALGAGYRTEDILAAVPGFLVQTILALHSHGRPVRGLATGLVALLHAETQTLFRFNAAYEEQTRVVGARIAGRRADLRSANSKGLRARKAAARVLRTSILPAGHRARAAVERAAARAETPAATVASVRTIAELIHELREDAKLRLLLDEYGYGEAALAELRGLADTIETLDKAGAGLTPPVEMSQRALDHQDGLVLTLLRAIWTPLRDAREEGAAIALPPLGAITRLVARGDVNDGEDVEGDEPAAPSEPRTS